MWIRYAFHAVGTEPAVHPAPGPWWHLGGGLMLAYLPDNVALTTFWPDATLPVSRPARAPQFSPATPRPDWWTGPGEDYTPDPLKYALPPLEM